MKLRLTIDFHLDLIDDEPDEYPIVGDHEGEHIIFTPEQC
jgi:hypothetical protein